MSFKSTLHLDNKDLGLFLLRLSISVLVFFNLGIPKLDLLFSGNTEFVALPLMTTIELILPLFVIVGMFVRPISIIMIFHFFVSLMIDPLLSGSFAFLLMIPFLALIFTGPGKISLRFRKFSRVTSLWL